MARYLAIDLGEKRIGLAISDPTFTIAQPYKTIPFKNLKQLVKDLKQVIHDKEISKVIIGLPLTLKGTFSQKTTEVDEIITELQERLKPVPVVKFDERLTTIQAHSTLKQMGKSPSRHRERVDQLAAMHLLQNYLDRENNWRKQDDT